jgi:hypothetical protein
MIIYSSSDDFPEECGDVPSRIRRWTLLRD